MATIQLKRSSKPVQNLMMKSKNGTKYYIKRFYTPSSTRCNWLDQNCGDVPRVTRPQNEVISEMLRGGHAIQLAHSSLLKGIISSLIGDKIPQKQTLKQLLKQEDVAIERLKEMVLKQDFRFRPSIFGSFMYSSSQIMGQMVSFLGLNASESFIIGMKQAIGDYYNDQIRELYTPEFAQKHTEKEINLLKELFKQIRDEELAFVDTKLHVHSQTQTQMQSDEPVATKVGKMSTKFLLQLVQRC